MSLSIIPESAPFNTEQRAWLNGFLSGWLGLQEAGNFPIPVVQAPTPPAPVDDHPWHDPALSIHERMGLAEGRPLPERLMAAMAQLDCGACGYVCKTYSEALANGSESSTTLCSPGGTETSRLLKRLVQEKPGTSSSGGAAVVPLASPIGSRRNPYVAKILKSYRLNKPGSEKSVHHVEIDLNGSGLSYKVGDALGVIPSNCNDLVELIIAELGTSANVSSIREALTHERCLVEIPDAFLTLLAGSALEFEEAEILRKMISDDGPESGMDVLDLLRMFPSARPAPDELVASLSMLKPRLYSISSSPRKHAGQVHLTVGRVSRKVGGRERKGVASTMLSDRVGQGAPIRVFFHPSKNFSIPGDHTTPAIMIGPGTGIAPFRAFLHERESLGATGKNWLFFGDQRSEFDFLYEGELRELSERGVLTRLDLAFSRDGDEKFNVQHKIREQGAELWSWIKEGASIYVCGDARKMAPDVDQALRDVLQEHGGMDRQSARAFMADLAETGRYCRDVY